MDTRDWVLGAEACRRLHVGRDALPVVCRRNGIRRLALPGAFVRYNTEDIARVMSRAIVLDGEPARAGA